MKYCYRCLQPDTRPNSTFLTSGICTACDYFEKLKDVDWQERINILEEMIKNYKENKNKKIKFDCIIGVSGGKDSTRQALWVRDKLKLNPLLVCLTYPPEQVTERGTNNISNLINLGFDVVVSAPSPETWRQMMKISFEKFTNWAKSTELALFSSVPRIAIQYKISLILWGENPGLQLGDLKTLGKTGYDGNNLRNMNTLSGGGNSWIEVAGVNRKKLLPYEYPTKEEFDKNKLQIVYLGWFLGDWSLINNGMYAVANGLEIRKDKVNDTGDLHGITSLDEDWVTLNQMIKYYKFGFGRVTDYVNEEIRIGRMKRNEGIELVEKYDDACNEKYIHSFCEYIQISVDQFWARVHESMNRDLFKLQSNGQIKRKFKVGYGL